MKTELIMLSTKYLLNILFTVKKKDRKGELNFTVLLVLKIAYTAIKYAEIYTNISNEITKIHIQILVALLDITSN